jgi:hypothetical protein
MTPLLSARRLVPFALALLGCGGFFMPADRLRPQAAFDLQCPEAELVMVPLGGDCDKKLADKYECTLGVRGCGKQTTYSHVPNGPWIANAPAPTK